MAFWLMFAGFNLTFFMMHLAGLRGMPRRIATYPEGIGWDRLNILSTIGAFILAAGVAVFIWDFFRHGRKGPEAGHDPWSAATLEWLYPPTAPGCNFRTIPEISSREPLWDQLELTARPPGEIDGGLRACPDNRRETFGCDPVSGEPVRILRLPHPTCFPLIAAAGLAVLMAAQLTLFAVVLTLSPAPWHTWHLATTLPYGLSALGDQQLAGAMMWWRGADCSWCRWRA